MLARAGALGLVLAVVATAPAAAAVRGRVLVSPASPLVGKRAVIEVRTAAKGHRLALELVSPTGVQRHVWLRRVAPGLWRTAYHFADDGQWTLRVHAGAIAASDAVLVLQNGALAPAPRGNAGAGPGALLDGGTMGLVPRLP